MLTDNYNLFCEILETVRLFETYRSGHPEVFCKSGDLTTVKVLQVNTCYGIQF